MGKFVFRLESILNLKVQIEENLKNEMGKAIQELEYQKGVLIQIEQQKEEQIERMGLSYQDGVLAGVLREYNFHLKFLNNKIVLQKEYINLAQVNVDKYRENLIKAVQERKMLEKLKSKKYEEYVKEQINQEQKLNDEIVSFKIYSGD